MNSYNRNDRRYFLLPVQISGRAWQALGLKAEPIDRSGSPVFALRTVANRLQGLRPGRGISAGQLLLLSLLTRTFRLLTERYLEAHRCAIGLEEAEIAGNPIPMPALPQTMRHFVQLFPPAALEPDMPVSHFLEGEEGTSNRRNTVVELFILSVQTSNPAAEDFRELFDDTELENACPYRQILTELDGRLRQESVPGLFGRSLLELLHAPIVASPNSLSGQLEYIRKTWAELLPEDLLRDLMIAFDILREEEQMRGGGPGPIPVPRFGRGLDYDEPERFSPDADWMSNVVLIAKTVYVWLDQLSKRYGRPFHRLDQIPDEELDRLAAWGFTGLWLIGIWERSPASQKIKQIMGNPEAVSSAYSLYDYVEAQDLGGEEALASLQERCRRRGIRLGCDVVPNHTGIYSRWTREHPDWYVQVDHPPYPAYNYTSHNLSFDGDISLFIEDGYWNHSDAAVVFKHIDNHTGRTRYIYHGNDGTHLPWNDTAQLNFLIPEVREAMIRTILRVAQRYKIIRFDAAMTLAKKHFQRLWFPQPGGGAGVPSRAEHAMNREDFERVFPVEFWREVVDRVAAEVPDTLLLAEAFWLMEGYFVRTLGMHRVYNSAFMNMLKNEDNAKYRSVIKNILDFNPQILKRFVNFMNNPDEDTAVAQFGTGEKYFGVAMLLVTMPGLPMFGHGQIEGFREKYGMEYRRAYFDEQVNEGLVHHHIAQIFPLMRRRQLFSGSEHFVLYDFFVDGQVNEDVFAFSNRFGQEKAIIAYNNRYGDTGGWIRTSVPKRVRHGNGEEIIIQPTLGEALELRSDPGRYYRAREHRTGMEYLFRGQDLVQQGLRVQLGPYQYHILLDFREVEDLDGTWEGLYHQLGGSPVVRLDDAWKKIRYASLIETFRRAAFPPLFKRVGTLLEKTAEDWPDDTAFAAFLRQSTVFYAALRHEAELPAGAEKLASSMVDGLKAFQQLAEPAGLLKSEKKALSELRRCFPAATATSGAEVPRAQLYRVLLPWLLLRPLGEPVQKKGAERLAAWMEEYHLTTTLEEVLHSEPEPPFNLPEGDAAAEALLVQILLRHRPFDHSVGGERGQLGGILKDPAVQSFIGCNWFEGVRWFNRERLETLLFWLYISSAVDTVLHVEENRRKIPGEIAERHRYLMGCLESAEKTGYRMDLYLQLV
jgi:glycosidase